MTSYPVVRSLRDLPDKGVYTLIIRLDKALEIKIGSLGPRVFKPGFYLYTGSGLGSGPLGLRGRVERHLGLRGRRRAFWHIDYFLMSPGAMVKAVVAARTEERKECEVNKALLEGLRASVPIRGFGSSDCPSGCPAHLLYTGHEDPTEGVVGIYLSLGLEPLLVEATGLAGGA